EAIWVPLLVYLAWQATSAAGDTAVDYVIDTATGEDSQVLKNYGTNFAMAVATGGLGGKAKKVGKVIDKGDELAQAGRTAWRRLAGHAERGAEEGAGRLAREAGERGATRETTERASREAAEAGGGGKGGGFEVVERSGHGPVAPQAAKGTAASQPRTYITYELKNPQGEVVYVGRASGVGTPEQVLQQRRAKGHDVFDATPGLKAEVKAVQGNAAANKGAEGVFYEKRLREGAPLLNDPKSPPLSSKPAKAPEVRAKIQAYSDDLNEP
ncbi:MAG: hypothetical protein U1D97_01135, partial [Desulfuromonadales bacterium]|nr:hypothetical protein [Desulfuromonadales bacterium]